MDSALSAVVTVGEACKLWGFSRTKVQHAIDTGKVSARFSSGIWLLSLKQSVELWGLPPKGEQKS